MAEPSAEIDIYPVGLLRDLRMFVHSPQSLGKRWRRLRYALRCGIYDRARRRAWRDLKNYFNGYLAEHRTRGTRGGTGWTQGRAYNDLQRHLEQIRRHEEVRDAG